MSTVKKCKVLLLPTNAKANLFINNVNGKLLFDNDSTLHRVLPKGIYQHIYITSNEKIKEGDWYFATDCIEKCSCKEEVNDLTEACKKIIATTDKSLIEESRLMRECFPLAIGQPSQSFIEYFIEEYNKANIITDVQVEYEYQYYSSKEFYGNNANWVTCDENQYNSIKETIPTCPIRETLKVSKNNTITIKKLKDNWNKKEVSNLLIKAMGDAVKNDRIPNHISIAEFSINWIDKNL